MGLFGLLFVRLCLGRWFRFNTETHSVSYNVEAVIVAHSNSTFHQNLSAFGNVFGHSFTVFAKYRDGKERCFVLPLTDTNSKSSVAKKNSSLPFSARLPWLHCRPRLVFGSPLYITSFLS